MAQHLQVQGEFGFRNVRLVKSEEKSLGIGSYGAVYRAQCDQLVCAAKVLHPILFQTRDPGSYRIVERFQREIEFLSGLRHPNIIQYLGSCEDPETRLPVLFMEMMDESLTTYLERPADPPPLHLYVQVDIAHDVAQALFHLHQHQVLHRDLSSNNVLLIGSRRAKLTDFGMAKLLGSDPRLTPTYCPGTNVYMSPEALADPPTYTSKLDIFSCGVLIVQLITRKFPNPGPRTHTLQINDPRVPSGRVHVDVPESERRKEHLDLISPTHPLLSIALDCLKDKERQRLTVDQLCSHLVCLKESVCYQDSMQQDIVGGASSTARHQELEQQPREKESTVETLTKEVHQLHLQREVKEEVIRNKEELLHQKNAHIEQLRQEVQHLQSRLEDNELVIGSLQQSLEQKEALLHSQDELLSHGKVQSRERSDGKEVKLQWRDAPSALFATRGHSVAVSGSIIFCCGSGTRVFTFDWKSRQWTSLLDCPKKFFSIAVVNGELTAIGGNNLSNDVATKSLLTLTKETLGSSAWIEKMLPMTYFHNDPAVATTNTSLIVAGGWGPDKQKAAVELMDIQTLLWFNLASLPYPITHATAAICEDRIYLGGGFNDVSRKSVLTCKIQDLLQSKSPSSQPDTCINSRIVWRDISSLSVCFFSLVVFDNKLLALGGKTTGEATDSASEVMQYDVTTDSWNIISRMKLKRNLSLAAVLPTHTLLVVCGGCTPDGKSTTAVEVCSYNC